MNNKDIDKIIDAVEEKIEAVVNGKIDALKIQIEKHEEKLKPVLEVYTTANNVGRFVKWISGIMLAGALLYTYIKGWII